MKVLYLIIEMIGYSTPCGAIFVTLLDGTARGSLNKILSEVSMRSKHDENKKLCSFKVKLCFLILVLCFLNIAFYFSNLDFVSAVSYTTSTNVQFTFNPTLSLSISSADLIISNLAPGSSADSNEITVGISTNAAYGYYLSATVGTATSGETYNTTNLVNGNNVFTSLATTDNISSMNLANDNTWGYAFATYDNANSTWNSYSNYSGLPLDNDDNGETGAKLIETENASDSRNIKFKIGAKASSSQIAGEYTNVVNFYAVTNPTPPFLYETIAEMSKGRQTAADLQATITTPTSTNPAEDTSNSGVFEYDPSVFGEASDASNDYKIYYYRGILETNPGTYGSAGSANAYPNYVKLSNNTCWRIVRTTGSGGVKMIYNGIWGNNTCAMSQSSVLVTTLAFAAKGSSQASSWSHNMAYVGYTYNDNVTDITAATALGIILGNDINPRLNNTRSNIKTYIEDTWYANNMTRYTNMLEANAGYCNDRTVYLSRVLQSESVTTQPFLSNNNTTDYLFGAAYRVGGSSTIKTPTLNCPRRVVDLYHYVANSVGVSNELKYPTALLTADELTLAGNGFTSGGFITAYSRQSYLCSGSYFWLLSPYHRHASFAEVFHVHDGGSIVSTTVTMSNGGIRPVISLNSWTLITGGTGTATDPWTVE